jgi:dolichol-phosphate mannosyltransferase
MLSKYTGVFLGIGAVLAVIAYRPWRRHLLTPHPYAAALLAFLMFTPVLIWNAQHDWASFRFQFAGRFAGQSFSAASVLSYAGLQFVVATPVIVAAIAWFCARTFAKPRRLFAPRWIIVACFSAPLFAVMAYKSLRYNIHLNWTLPLYLSLLPAVAQLGLAQTRRMRQQLQGFSWHKAILATLLISAGADALAIIYLLVLQPHVQWISALRPWAQIAANVQTIEENLEAETGREPLVIAGGKYRLASELAFYRTPLERKIRASDFTTSQWIVHGSGLGYPYWAEEKRWTNSDCVIVDDNNEIDKFASRFEHFEIKDEISYGRSRYRIAIGRGWRN